MTTNEKFKHWRERELKIDGKKRPSGTRLANYLNQMIEKEYEARGEIIPAGARIFQPNIVALEKGDLSEHIFDKIVNAIYKYMDVPQDYFGSYDDLRNPGEQIVSEPSVPYRTKIQELQEVVIALLKRNGDLEREKFEISQEILAITIENATLRQAVSALQAEIARIGARGDSA